MGWRRRGVLVAGLGTGVAFGLRVLAACSVDLTLPDNADADAGPDVVVIPDAATPGTKACEVDGDCKSASTCVTGRCDLPTKTCIFEQCPTGDPCRVAACDPAGACGAPVPLAFHAGSFPVSARLACPACAAFVPPFAFVATNQLDLIGFDLADLSAGTPPVVALPRLPFTPFKMVTFGRRLYILGRPSGIGRGEMPLAWLDVPDDPGLRALVPHLETLPFPFSLDVDQTDVFATVDNQLMVVQRQAAILYKIPHPDDGSTYAFVAPGSVQDQYPAAVNGTRVLLSRYQGPVGIPAVLGLSVVENAGTSLAKLDSELLSTPFSNMFGSLSDTRFATAPDSTTAWTMTYNQVAPEAGPTTGQDSVRLALLLKDATATSVSYGTTVAIESYNPPIDRNQRSIFGALVAVSAGTFVVFAPAHEDATTTSVQVVHRDPDEPSLVPARRYILSADNGTPTYVGSSDVALAVVPNATSDVSTVHVFAAGCGQ